jgi:hypothetical protein
VGSWFVTELGVVYLFSQFPPSLAFLDLRYKGSRFSAERLTPMFQELGRMCRYTDTEAVDALPIAFLPWETLAEVKKRGIDQDFLSLSDFVKQVCMWINGVLEFHHFF